jgi:hypothetical protein
MDTFQEEKYQVINLNHSPSLFYILPNEKIAIGSTESKNLSIYNLILN